MSFFGKRKERARPLPDWRMILTTTAYARCPKVKCSFEEYGPAGWIDRLAVLCEMAPDTVSALDLVEAALKEIEAPMIDRLDYEKMWFREMCCQ